MRAFFLTPLAIFLIVIIVMLAKLLDSGVKPPSQMVGKPLPAFSLPAAYEGTPGLNNTDLTDKYTLLNIFGSWCITCKIEHPFLVKLKADNLIQVYGIDWMDKPEALAKWLKEEGNPYTEIGSDPEGKVVVDLGVTGAPETFLISKGVVIYHHAGPVTEELWVTQILPLMESGK